MSQIPHILLEYRDVGTTEIRSRCLACFVKQLCNGPATDNDSMLRANIRLDGGITWLASALSFFRRVMFSASCGTFVETYVLSLPLRPFIEE